MLQIFKKDNTGIWKDLRARNQAQLQAAQPGQRVAAVEDDFQGLASALGVSEGSLENSLFGDRAWSGKLSYSRLRGALDTMRAFSQNPGKGAGRRFTLSSAGGSFRKTSLFGRQNSLNDASLGDNSDNAMRGVPVVPLLRRLLCGCCSQRNVRNHSSKLNTVLSNFDESAVPETAVATAAPSSSGAASTYYPPARFRQEAASTGDPGRGRADDLGSVASAAAPGSVAGR
jgi:hypothetical protein